MGRVIDENGVTISQEKRQNVLDFPLPQRQKELKSFIGLINYFREHVGDMSTKAKVLNEMVTPYVPRSKLTWTTEQEKVFFQVRDEVANCPALFWVDPNAQVIVMTDASDYGYGCYIYQVKTDAQGNTKEYPIRFMSHSFVGAQLNWSTIEKEAFAIFMTLKKFDFLLRDIHFLLRTDHKNLTYMNTNSSQKVKRW